TSSYTLGHLLTVPSSPGLVLDLFQDGELWLYNFNNGQSAQLLNLKTLQTDISNIYNIVPGGVVILPGAAQTSYADLAVYPRADGADYFFTGLSLGVFPFVTRLRTYTDGRPSEAKVVAASSATTTPNNGLARGIAVNSQGTVLTTLPVAGQSGTGNF